MRGATEREERPTSWACLGKRAATAWQSQPNARGRGGATGVAVRARLCQSVLKGTQHSGEPRAAHPDFRKRRSAGAMHTSPPSLRGTGNLGWALKTPFRCAGVPGTATPY